MTRLALGAIVVVAAAAVALAGSGPGGVVLWEVVVGAALVVVLWRRWPVAARPVESLVGGDANFGRTGLGRVATLELEVKAATDPALGGDVRLRRRLAALAEHRAGVAPGSLSDATGVSILGPSAWATISGHGPMTEAEIERLIERIEEL